MNSQIRAISVVSLDEKIARTERMLQRMEEDRPYMAARLSPLGDEYRQSVSAFAERLRAEAEAELSRLRAARKS
jgi:hypothetical protein